MELRKWNKIILAKAVKIEPGFAYFVDRLTGDVVSTNLNDPDYKLNIKQRHKERAVRQNKAITERANKKATRTAQRLEKNAEERKKILQG